MLKSKKVTMAINAIVTFTLAILLLPSMSFAEIQPYQMRRLILYQSDCKLIEINPLEHEEAGELMFMASCENLAFYPDGLRIHCPDASDERSCKILDQAKKFEHLKLLQ